MCRNCTEYEDQDINTTFEAFYIDSDYSLEKSLEMTRAFYGIKHTDKVLDIINDYNED